MRALPLVAAALLAACARPPSPPAGDADAPPELSLSSEVRPLRYALDLTVVPERELFEGAVAIEVELSRPLSRVWMHARELAVRDVAVEVGGAARKATFTQASDGGVARLAVATPIPAGRATLRLRFEGRFAERGPGLARAGRYAFARLGPGDARRVFPCFDDPALQASFEVALTVPADAVAVSTGAAGAEERLGDGLKRLRFASTPPLSPHLLALAAGPFEVTTPAAPPAAEQRAAPPAVRLLRPARSSRADFALALESARQLVPVLERWLGTGFPYPRLELLAVPAQDDLAGVAAGALVVPAHRLAFDAARQPIARQLAVLEDVAGAIGRQWFEGLVAPAGPDDAWIPGGFAALLRNVALERWRPDWQQADEEARRVASAVRRTGLPADRPLRPTAIPAGAAWPALEPRAEVQAAAVLRALERLAGEGAFRAGLAAHLAAHARGAASTAALAAALSQAAGRDLGPVLRAQLDEPGAPLVEGRTICDGAGPRLELTVGRWRPMGSGAAPLAPTIPVCVRFEAAGALGERCGLAEGGRAALLLPACPRWVMPDAGGRSWLSFALAPADQARLRDAGFAHLSAPERVAVGAALLAVADAGRTPFAEALASLAALARDGAAAVALVPAAAFVQASERLVTDEARPRARAALAELYRPRLAALGLDPAPGDSAERRRLRAELVRLLVTVARDPEATRALQARGLAYLAPGEADFRHGAVSPDLAAPALVAAIDERDPASFEALVRRLPAASREDRARALEALGALRRPALSDRVLDLVADPRLSGAERVALLRAQARSPETRDGAWKALQARWDELVAALEPRGAADLPRAAEALCDRKRAAEARRFFETRAARVPGARGAAEETLERIEACAARREAQGPSASAYFTGRERPPS